MFLELIFCSRLSVGPVAARFASKVKIGCGHLIAPSGPFFGSPHGLLVAVLVAAPARERGGLVCSSLSSPQRRPGVARPVYVSVLVPVRSRGRGRRRGSRLGPARLVLRGACVSLAGMLVFMMPLATHGSQSTLSWTSSSRSHLALGRPHLRDFSNTIPCTQTSHASTARQGGVPAACRCFVRLSSFKRLPGREEAWPARRCPR